MKSGNCIKERTGGLKPSTHLVPILIAGDARLCNPAMVVSPALSTPVAACCTVNEAVSEASPDTQDRLDTFIGEIQMRIPTPSGEGGP